MSTQLKTLKKVGSRKKDLSITRYWGGDKKGVCYQLTQEMEDGNVGYVQLNKEEFAKVLSIIIKE